MQNSLQNQLTDHNGNAAIMTLICIDDENFTFLTKINTLCSKVLKIPLVFHPEINLL